MFDKLIAFSEFGFPKSHAYAFAVLAYQSAWLRHYYAAEYYAALLNNQPMGFYAPHVLIGDARRHKLQVLRVGINSSAAGCKPVPLAQPAPKLDGTTVTARCPNRHGDCHRRRLPELSKRYGD